MRNTKLSSRRFLASLCLGQGQFFVNCDDAFVAYVSVVSLAFALELLLSEFLLYRYDHDELPGESED